jgi:hypothetical protein
VYSLYADIMSFYMMHLASVDFGVLGGGLVL